MFHILIRSLLHGQLLGPAEANWYLYSSFGPISFPLSGEQESAAVHGYLLSVCLQMGDIV